MSDSSDLLNGLLPFPVSFTTLALILFAILAMVGFVRGVLRLIFGTIALGIGAVAAYFVYQRAPEFIESPRGILVAAIAAGLVTFIAARYLIINILLRPVLGKHQGSTGKVGALVSLVPAAFLIWVLASGFRLTGTVMEMEQVGENVTAPDGEQIVEKWIAHWRRAMDNDSLARLLAHIDPFVERGKSALVNLLISSRDESAPDALADTDDEAAAIINSPAMRQLRADPEIRRMIDSGEYVQLLQHPKVRDALKESNMAERLKSIDIVERLEKALYSGGDQGQPKVRKRIARRLWREGEPEPETN